MGGIPENTYIPKEQSSHSSNAENYTKAYSSSFTVPIMSSVEQSESSKDQGPLAQKTRQKYTDQIDETLRDLDRVESSMAAREELNEDSWIVSSLIEFTRGTELESYGFHIIANNIREQLNNAKLSQDIVPMMLALRRNKPFVGLLRSYLDIYIENMELGGKHWVTGLTLTKDISFATASALGGAAVGGSVIAGGIFGAGAAFVDNAATEVSNYFNNANFDLDLAIDNVISRTITGGAFGLVGGLLGELPRLNSIFNADSLFLKLLSNSVANYGFGQLDSKIWSSLQNVAGSTVKPEELDIDFDFSIPAKLLAYAIQKRASFIDSKTDSFYQDGEEIYYGKGQYGSDVKKFIKRSNKSSSSVPDLYVSAQNKVKKLEKDLNKYLAKLNQYESVIKICTSSRFVKCYFGKYVLEVLTNDQNEDYKRTKKRMTFQLGTYHGWDIISDEQYKKLDNAVDKMNDEVVPTIKDLTSTFINMFLYLSALVKYNLYTQSAGAGTK